MTARKLRSLKLVTALFALTGCNYVGLFGPDSPSDFTVATPLRMGATGHSMFFAGANQTYNCPLLGAAVVLTAESPAGTKGVSFRLAYVRSATKVRDDRVTIETPREGLSITSRSEFWLWSPHKSGDWRRVPRKGGRVSLSTPEATTVSVSTIGINHFLLRAIDASGAELFRATAIPKNGVVYLRDGTLSARFATYTGHSEHDCGYYDAGPEATKALARYESRIPR